MSIMLRSSAIWSDDVIPSSDMGRVDIDRFPAPQQDDVMELYETAIESAKKYGFTQFEALGTSLHFLIIIATYN